MPDLEFQPVNSTFPLKTKRAVSAQISVCVGCCCGNVARGKPQVPVERLKQEWRERGLSKYVQLTVSGCLGPCDVVNVIRISGDHEDIWLGRLQTLDDYLALADWANQSKVEGKPAQLSPQMLERRFNPFHPTNLNGRPALEMGENP